MQDNRKDYEFQYIESGSFSPANKEGIGYLHNSILMAKSISDLVFTNNQYANKILNRDNHLYYALFNDIKTHKKNLIIIGRQFNEQTVYTYLFSKERGIRDDLKIINVNYNSKPEYGLETEKLLYNSNWINCSASDFLEFLQRYKYKIKDIDLPGAVTINQGFIDAINKGEKFSKSKFYSAKQDDNCQWFGILNEYDVIRNDHPKIKKEVLNAFSTVTTSKVVAVVHGTGGCGKSTLLRRLAVELIKESDFEIIWVKDLQLGNFVLNALPKIRADIGNRYLVFIEDWYRLTAGENNEVGNTLLKTTETISNIRLVIGDRDIKGKVYLLNIVKSENIFELTEIENRTILGKIIAKHDEWKLASELVLNNPQSYSSPLFLILFAIAGVSENRIDNVNIDFNDLEKTVRRIAKYDLRKIEKHYPGYALALHYWSCVYDKYKIFISYNSFLEVADFYNKNKDISTYFKNWKTDTEVLNKLKLYINVSPNENLAERFQKIDLIQFNHDKLAESVLSKVEFEGWEPYDDIQKKKLLNTITDYGDGYSASVLLKTFLEFENQIFISNQERKSYIDKLFYQKSNRYFQYLSFLKKLNLSSSELYN